MPEPHEGHVELIHRIVDVHSWLHLNGLLVLNTRVGTEFEAIAEITQKGAHSGEKKLVTSKLCLILLNV